MKHSQFKEWIPLLGYGELDEDEKYLLQQHLKSCSECAHQLEELNHLQEMLGRRSEIPDQVLESARRELRIRMLAMSERKSASWFWSWLPAWQGALAGGLCILLGLGIGYLLFRGRQDGPPGTLITPSVPNKWASIEDADISNVRFLDADPSDGQVEFSYEATMPVRLKGDVNDERIQQILSRALVNGQNPGTRLRAVGVFNTNQMKQPDPEVKKALITAVKLDENDGVRKQALAALLNFPFDVEVRDSLLYVLTSDPNPALRIAAIDAIKTENSRDPKVLRVLEERMQTDANEYIRVRSRAVVEEAKEK
jgi:hypothetical protein